MSWDSIFGFLIFMLIAAFSIINKIYEERKSEERKATRKTVRPEDLPEATRRQLYGEGGRPGSYEPPVAKPREAPPPVRPERQGSPPPLVRQGTPRSAPPRATPQPQYPQPAPVDRPAPQAAGESALPWDEGTAPASGHPATMAQAHEQMQRQRQLQQQLRLAEQRKREAGQQTAQARKQAQQHAARAPQQRPAKRPHTGREPAREFQQRLLQMFNNPNDLRRGIIFREILSTPPGLRDSLGPFQP